MTAMTAEEAAWVREHAWTVAMRRQWRQIPAVYSMCPCQYGPCGRCAAGECESCSCLVGGAEWAAARADVPAGYVEDHRGYIPALGGAGSWAVWEAGVRHDSRCPCHRHGHRTRREPEDLLELLEAVCRG